MIIGVTKCKVYVDPLFVGQPKRHRFIYDNSNIKGLIVRIIDKRLSVKVDIINKGQYLKRDI